MNGPERMHDLAFQMLDDGTIRLEQSAGIGESDVIDLHPQQLRLLAERTGLINSEGASFPKGFLRRLLRLRADAVDLYDLLDSAPCFPPGSGPTDDVKEAGCLVDEFEALLEDFGLSGRPLWALFNDMEGPSSGQQAPSSTEPPQQSYPRNDCAPGGEQLGLPV